MLLPMMFGIHPLRASNVCLQVPGWSWDPLEARWRQMYSRLQDYAAEHGRLPPRSCGALDRWVDRQRHACKVDMLSDERLRLLEAISCWSWDPLEALWRQMYGQLQDYVAEHGRLPPVNTSGALGVWVNTQRQVYKDGMLSEERQRLLEAISCWSWDPLKDQWRQMYARLQDYVAEHGRLPPQALGSLGLWVTKQRQTRNTGMLSDERQRLLEAISCWDWDPLEDQWRQMYAQLQDYVAEHGRLPPVKTSGALGIWIDTQRQACKNSILSEERQRLLEAISCWSWDLQEAQWQRMYGQLQDYVAEHGQLPPLNTSGALGIWVTTQRQARKNGMLSEERQRLLEAISCWSWDPLEDQWRQMYSRLQDYVAEHGRLPPRSCGALGRWVDRQQQARKNDKLSEERQRLLEAVPGWCWRL